MIRSKVFNYFGTLALTLTFALTGCSNGGDSGPSSTGNGSTPPDSGTLTGKIINNSDGTAVTAATVTVGTATTTTDDDGTYTFDDIPTGTDKVIDVTKTGFARGSKIATVMKNVTTRADMPLLPIEFTTEIDPTMPQILSANAAGTAQVELAANALVTSTGAAPTGNVTANITPLDPTSNPQLMPGNFSATVGTGAVASDGTIETFGAMEVTFSDSTGAALNLASGESATIRIPLAAGATSSPAIIPAYFYNATTGKWIEEGTLMLEGTAPDQYYTGTVTHFSYWNADMPLETTCITGKVVDDLGSAVSGARLQAQGSDYIGTSEAYTAADGTFTILVKANSSVILYANTSNALSQSIVVPTDAAGDVCTELLVNLTLGAVIGGSGSGSAKITLTWGTNPSDLDSHLTGPDPSISDSARFHVYFGDQGSLAVAPYANLDVDDTDSFGPEVTTITKFFPGVYRFSVHHFGGTGTIFSSPARVELTLNGETQVFTPPDPGATTIGVDTVWQVFEITVNGNGSTAVNTLNTYSDVNSFSINSAAGVIVQPFEDAWIFSNLPSK
jgi:hypothetical protein